MINLSSLLTPTILLILFFPILSQASVPLDVIINEIAWMGTKNSYNDEWIEFYNNTESEINLSNWKLISKDDSPQINLSGSIPANGFYLLERTNDDTVLEIAADQIYSGPMSNSGENFSLYDASEDLIDSVNCQAGWFAGDNNTKQTMERKNPSLPGDSPNNWGTSQNPGGTPKEKNSSFFESILKTVTKNETSSDDTMEEEALDKTAPQENLPPKTYPTNVILNEILPSPAGKDETEEWIELFNKNDFEADLSGWKISDTTGVVTVYVFPEKTKINSGGFLVISRPESKITLNNSGDGLKLIQPDGNVLDSINYENAPMGNSYNFMDGKWVWSDTLTPNSINIFSSDIKEKETILAKEKNNFSVSQLASAEKQMLASKNSLPPLFFALALAIISGTSILFIKKKMV
ncbi:MAG: lamin tail domain-containing protein [Parcubacteria group bacterium]